MKEWNKGYKELVIMAYKYEFFTEKYKMKGRFWLAANI